MCISATEAHDHGCGSPSATPAGESRRISCASSLARSSGWAPTRRPSRARDWEASPADLDASVSCSVLCVEDNPSNLKLIEEIFSLRPEIELMTVMQGNLGLELARQHLPALILLDLNLPDLPGERVLDELRREARTAHMPIVVRAPTRPKPRLSGCWPGGPTPT